LAVYLRLHDSEQKEYPLELIADLVREVQDGVLAVVHEMRAVRREAHGVRDAALSRDRLGRWVG
jgi:hypothetical protein